MRLAALSMFLVSCTTATASPAPVVSIPSPVDPGGLAALGRDTAVALGLVVPAMRDRLAVTVDPVPPWTHGRAAEGAVRAAPFSILRVSDPDHHVGLRIVFAVSATGVHAVLAWPL